MAITPADPPFRETDTAAFIYFDGVSTFGAMHGVAHIELVARILSPVPNTEDVMAQFVSVARLRGGLGALMLLRDSVEKAIQTLQQPQSAPTGEAATLN